MTEIINRSNRERIIEAEMQFVRDNGKILWRSSSPRLLQLGIHG